MHNPQKNNQKSCNPHAIPLQKNKVTNSNSNYKSKSYTARRRRAWTEKSRKAAAARCRLHKPWRFSTGPRTRVGKFNVRLNALKHGATSAHWRYLGRALHRHKKFLNELKRITEIRNQSMTSQTCATYTGAYHDILPYTAIYPRDIDLSRAILHKGGE